MQKSERHQGKGCRLGAFFVAFLLAATPLASIFKICSCEERDHWISPEGTAARKETSRFVALNITLELDRLVERVLQETNPHLTIGIISTMPTSDGTDAAAGEDPVE